MQLHLLLLLLSCCYPSIDSLSLSPIQENRQILAAHQVKLEDSNSSISDGNLTLYFFPETMYGVIEGQPSNISFAYSWTGQQDLIGRFALNEDFIAVLPNPNFTFVRKTLAPEAVRKNVTNITADEFPFKLEINGVFLGRVQLNLGINSNSGAQQQQQQQTDLKYRISVLRKPRLIDIIFRFAIWIFVIFANIGMGCEIDLKVVKKVLRRPVAPIVGFISQYLFMPLISFCVLLVIPLPASTALGYFGVGCAPGGGASNFYCLLLGGDVSLSITMTLISTIGALGMTPLYMFTLGQYILKQKDVSINIPYLNIVITLLLILIPSAIGYVIKLKLPRVARIYRRILKPAVLIFVIFMFTFGVYANLFIWKLFSPLMIAAGCILPYAGFILGGGLAALLRQSWPRVKTISLETGIQNPGVPILILQTSLPQPDADLSLVGPVAAATFTPLPLFVWVAGRIIYYRCYLKQNPFTRNKDGADDGSDNDDDDDDQADVELRQDGVDVAFLPKPSVEGEQL